MLFSGFKRGFWEEIQKTHQYFKPGLIFFVFNVCAVILSLQLTDSVRFVARRDVSIRLSCRLLDCIFVFMSHLFTSSLRELPGGSCLLSKPLGTICSQLDAIQKCLSNYRLWLICSEWKALIWCTQSLSLYHWCQRSACEHAIQSAPLSY